MGLNTLASTTFATGPDDETIVADIYTVSEPGVINSIQDDDVGVYPEDSIAALSGGDPDAVWNKKLADKALTDSELGNRLSNGLSSVASTYRSLSSTVKNSLTIDPLIGRTINATLGGSTTGIASKYIGDAKAVTSMIDGFTGGGYKVDFMDKGALSGLVAGLAYQGSRLGLPNSFTKMAQSITNKGVIMAAASQLLPKAARSGNLDLLKDISNTVLKTDIGRMMPNVIPETMRNYTIPTSLKKSGYAGQYDLLSGTFTDIQSGWNTIKRNGTSTLSGIALSGSKDAIALLESKVMSQRHEVTATSYVSGIAGNHAEDEKFMYVAKDSATTVRKELDYSFSTINTAPSKNISKYEISPQFA